MAIVGSKPVIAIDQDPLGIQGRNVSTAAGGSAGKEVWSKPLKGGAVAVLLMNAAPGKKGKGPALSISCTTEQVGLKKGATVTVHDVWGEKSLGTTTGSYTAKGIAYHDHVLITMTPSSTQAGIISVPKYSQAESLV